jgi:23S rRNA (adenine2503-C2)-methyltransferase
MLAISLHGPTQQLREELIPIAQTNKLKDLMHILQKYIQKTNNRIFYEYIMIRDVTDTPQIASQLADLLCGQLAHVNLIPYNQNPALSMKESKSQDIRKFKNILEKK